MTEISHALPPSEGRPAERLPAERLHVERLDNGLRVLVERRTIAPVVACWLHFGVGALNEAEGEEGACHFVEHMLFKGSERLGVGKVASRLEDLGGDINAYTTHDETVIHCSAPAQHLEEALDTLGEMAFRSLFLAAETEKERPVILDEIRGGQDDPARVLGEALSAAMWKRHPYGRPIAGTEEGVAALSRETLVAFRDRYFVPSNAALTVVGEVTFEQVREAAARLLEIDRPRPTKTPPAPEPPPEGRRVARVAHDFKENLLELSFRVPGHGHPDIPAIEILISALGEGASALLPRRLRFQERLAYGAWAMAEIGADGGSLVLGAAPLEGSCAPCLSRLAQIIREVAERGVPVDAFHQARVAILSDRIFQAETAEGRASTISWYEAHFGSPEAELRFREQVASLTPADVAAVARRYLDLDQVVLGLLGPETDWDPVRIDQLLAPAQDRRVATRATGVHREILENGVVVLVEPDPDAHIAAIRVVGLGGALLETPTTQGHGRAWADLLLEGASDLDAVSYLEAVESLAGSVRAWSARSLVGLTAEFPGDHVSLGLSLALLPLLRPRFDHDALDRVRDVSLEAVRTRSDDPLAIAWDMLWARMWPGHPFRFSSIGTEASIRRITAARMRRIHDRVIRPDNLVVAVAGSVEPESVVSSLRRLLSQLPRKRMELPRRQVPGPPLTSRHLRGRWSQAHLLVGFPGCSFNHHDVHVLEILSSILGAQGGRLFQRLREQEGLAYSTDASGIQALDGGIFACSMGTDPATLDRARKALHGVLDEMHSQPPDEAEVERARTSLTGGVQLDLQRASTRAMAMAQDERLGLDGTRYRENLQAVSRVGVDEVRRAIGEYLDPTRACWISLEGEGEEEEEGEEG